MGLDAVELIIEIEEAFDISFDDSEAGYIVTVGQLFDTIIKKLFLKSWKGCPTARAFYRLRSSFIKVLGVNRKDVRPSTSTLALLPIWQRRKIWSRLERDLAMRLPPLNNQAGVCLFLAAGITALATFILVGAISRDIFVAAAASLSSLLPAVLIGYIVGVLFIPPTLLTQYRSVGGLAKGLVALNYDKFVPPPPATPENDQIWDKLCDIISNQLSVKRENLHRETNFVKDLGM